MVSEEFIILWQQFQLMFSVTQAESAQLLITMKLVSVAVDMHLCTGIPSYKLL